MERCYTQIQNIKIMRNNYKIRGIPNGNNLPSQKELLLKKAVDIMKSHRRKSGNAVRIGQNDGVSGRDYSDLADCM